MNSSFQKWNIFHILHIWWFSVQEPSLGQQITIQILTKIQQITRIIIRKTSSVRMVLWCYICMEFESNFCYTLHHTHTPIKLPLPSNILLHTIHKWFFTKFYYNSLICSPSENTFPNKVPHLLSLYTPSPHSVHKHSFFPSSLMKIEDRHSISGVLYRYLILQIISAEVTWPQTKWLG